MTKANRIFCAFCLQFVLAALAGCGAGSGNTTFSTPGTSPMQINVGDSTADQVLSAQVTFNSIVLVTPSNSNVSVMANPTTVEVSHLAATAQPISQWNVPQGSYSGVTVTLGNVVVTFVNSSNGQIQQQTFTGPFMVSVNAGFTVNPGPMALTLDLNLAQSIVSFSNGGFSPAMSAVLNTVPAFGQQEEGTGAVHEMLGVVASAPGTSSFPFGSNQLSEPETVGVDGNTQFVGASGLNALAAGDIVLVNAVQQTNGTLLATTIESNTSVKQAVEGVVVSRTAGNPNHFQILVQNQAGTNAPSTGTLLTVASDNTTTYTFAAADANLAGLPFTPSFSSFGDLVVGQKVEVSTTSDFTAVATALRLESQTLAGSPTAQSGSQFTLSFATEAALRVLTGTNTIDFFLQPNTELVGMSGIVLGNPVHVRGLLFFDSGSGRYKLVASRITH